MRLMRKRRILTKKESKNWMTKNSDALRKRKRMMRMRMT
jgi:hypothetical protein